MIKTERYSRFTLQPAVDGERHVEVRLSDDATDDATDAEGQDGGSPSFRPAPPHQPRRNICYLVLGTLLIFVIGYLVGYISHRKPRVELVNCSKELDTETATGAATGTATAVVKPAPAVQLAWKDITNLLTQKLTSQAFDQTLRDFDLPKRSAGSEEDMKLANLMFDEFKTLEMDPWTDIHYIQLQTPDSERPNRILFGSDDFKPTGYLAYSATGEVQGKLVYGNYGRQEDLDVLQKNSIELKGSVLLLRAGSISFAEQVDNVATKGASAVLIYPDVKDYDYVSDTALYGHVHLGSGDPYTPGFPSFNHTQFPPTRSSGLPKIPAQTITAKMATALLHGGFLGGLKSVTYRLGGSENITVEVNNVLVNREIHNVFGVIKGFTDPDRYVVLGAQRDAWDRGYAKAAVGTSVLVQLARAVHEMVENDGFRPRRSLVFASWSAGEYGSVGATEWLEGYMSSIDKRVVTYISLDGMVMGHGSFMASASPLLHRLLERTMKAVRTTTTTHLMLTQLCTHQLRPMSMDDPAYPFLAFSGIPSISFHFISPNSETYAYYGTSLDNKDHLNYQTNHRTSEVTAVAAQFAGQMALRLIHDHVLNLDVGRYTREINQNMFVACSSFQRAASGIIRDIDNTDLNDKEACRLLNDRIMTVEHSLLSPYVSPLETPFRHLLLGRGSHTLASITKTTDMGQLHTQVALATWTLQGCANAMVGNIWDIDDEI
uniref:Transferrin receptor 1b n=1 Tax=Dicentrarchus labrax TaxID=13489 RepID=A0A8P4G223_DICLA